MNRPFPSTLGSMVKLDHWEGQAIDHAGPFSGLF